MKGYTHSYFSVALFSSHQGVFFLHIILYIYAEHPDAYFCMLRIFLCPILQEVSQYTALFTEVKIPDINRPALQLAGFFDHFDCERIQLIGYVEYTYLQTLEY